MVGRELFVLLIEGDEDTARRLSQMLWSLSWNRYVVEWVKTTAEARLRLKGSFYDVCLLGDINRHKQADALQQVLDADPSIPIVVISQHRQDGLSFIELGATEALARDVITGPLLDRTLQFAIRQRVVMDELERRTNYDPVTGLPSRVLFLRRIEEALERVRRIPQLEAAVLLLDIDSFKLVNDGLGRDIGDKLLLAVSDRIRQVLRDEDVLSRPGGDEFSVLLLGGRMSDVAGQVVERIHESMKLPFYIESHEVFSSLSVGIALSSQGQDSPSALLRDADTAMYRARQRGRGHHEVFMRSMHEEIVARLQLESDIRRGLQRGEFLSFYQPIIDVSSNKVVSLEALARWEHPSRGLLPPGQFLDVAEETGLILPLGWQLLDLACMKAAKWPGKHPPSLSVNLSASQLGSIELLGRVSRALQRSGLPAQRLKLEITEGSLVDNEGICDDSLAQLVNMGVEIHLDDFGTGYSSLAYIERFPLKGLKIDRSFVREVVSNPRRRSIIKSIVDIGCSLDMSVVAEGIETQEELAFLESMNCKLVQGFYFARPMPGRNVGTYLRTSSLQVG